MDSTVKYPKRLIEVDLPIKRISAHARREKSIRHGHISTLHIWWARRPLAACRAVICAALWPDPVDENCPQSFRNLAADYITNFAKKAAKNQDLAKHCSPEVWQKWLVLSKAENSLDADNSQHLNILRYRLLDFIADFANWDNSTQPDYLETSRNLTQAAHEALGGISGTKPLVVDPFAGGGSIPLEALRVGADAFASDINPVAVLLNKVVLEYIPKYGQQLADEVRKWGQWVKEEAEKELAEFYPKDADGSTPIAYLWARTIICEGPGCGAEVPIAKSLLLAKRSSSNILLNILPHRENKTISTSVHEQAKTLQIPPGTAKRSSVTCPICNFTTPAANVRKQFISRCGGTADAKLLAVVTSKGDEKTRYYRVPTLNDLKIAEKARIVIKNLQEITTQNSLFPDEKLPYLRSIFNVNLIGITQWAYLFTPRQLLLLTTFAKFIKELIHKNTEKDLAVALASCLAIALDKMADFHTSLTTWINVGEKIGHTFGRQALGIVWDYAEANPFADISGCWDRCIDYLSKVIEHNQYLLSEGNVQQTSATENPLPDDSVAAVITDPPYYDSVPYADLSDFFYVWLKRTLGDVHPSMFNANLSPKEKEIVQLAERNPIYSYKTQEHFEKLMGLAMQENRRILALSGISIVVFAHKGTAAWESQLQAMVDAGWIITGSWAIDTERQGRLRAMDSAALASSIHLVCRPRTSDSIGDWRDILQELPQRIHEWMPRLASEGVVGADAIFACLGPALEIFSRYSSVEKASGELVTLKEYLEYVWAAVSKEALSMIFSNADTTSFEEDARLTAMWLWTLSTGTIDNSSDSSELESEDEEDEENSSKSSKNGGYTLEFDAARKIAQGLGAHLEQLTRLVEVKGDKARLLPVSERTQYLFGKQESQAPSKTKGKSKSKKKEVEQLNLFAMLGITEEEDNTDWGEKTVPPLGNSTLDRIHQSMILFAAGRSEALKRFLVEEGAGNDQRFWGLAQALSALYPTGTEEKRWVDGVLARKKGLGF